MNFRELRESRGQTVDALAAGAAVDRTTITKLESGQIPGPRWTTITKLAAALGVEPAVVGEAIAASVAEAA